MKTKYQIVFLGEPNGLVSLIIDTVRERVENLGIRYDAISIMGFNNFYATYKANAPTVALYFGEDSGNFEHLDILNVLIRDSAFVIPVVSNLSNFSDKVPQQIASINGFQLQSELQVEALSALILEGLSLLRLSRRLFISYRRSESSGVAIQLYERLEAAGFDVFLDTHSIRSGEVFQDELWHRLVDTDVVVLLNTKGFLESEWTKEELAKASAMSIGILQLVWPDHVPESNSGLTIQHQLTPLDFINESFKDSKSSLTETTIESVISETESLRARTLGARQDNIVTEFIKVAQKLNIPVSLQPEKFITFFKANGNMLVVIPTVGVPHAFTYNQSEELIKTIRKLKAEKVFLLYDHISIREKWISHLSWLDQYLPVGSIKVVEAESWLRKIGSK